MLEDWATGPICRPYAGRDVVLIPFCIESEQIWFRIQDFDAPHAHMHRLLRATKPLNNARRYAVASKPRLYSRAKRPYAKMASAAETDVQAEAVANSSGITPDSLKATLKEKLQASHVDINDMSGK